MVSTQFWGELWLQTRLDFGLGNLAENISRFNWLCRAIYMISVFNLHCYNMSIIQVPLLFKIKPIRFKKTINPRLKFAIKAINFNICIQK